MRGLLRFVFALAACGILLYGGMNLTSYLRESKATTSYQEDLVDQVLEVKPTESVPVPEPRPDAEPEEAESESTEPTLPAETAPVEVDFVTLLETNSDVVGWLYCPDSQINLPLVQGTDNAKYLHTRLDGTGSASGTLFLDYQNAGNFSDVNTVIYGHNMKNGTMFAGLLKYWSEDYYDTHPDMWLLTPGGDYRVELLAGFVTYANAPIYAIDAEPEEVVELVENAMAQSSFRTGAELSPEDRFLTMSTCSYEFDEARYVIIGRLVPLG